MEIAIGIIFLALFAGAFFLLILIGGFILWRRSKRRGFSSPSQFSAIGNQTAVTDSIDENYSDDNDLAFAEASDYSISSVNKSNSSLENKEATASMSFESATEGGSYASGSSDYSDSSSSSSGYDSSSSSDSSGSDSGSSSSSWD